MMVVGRIGVWSCLSVCVCVHIFCLYFLRVAIQRRNEDVRSWRFAACGFIRGDSNENRIDFLQEVLRCR